MSCMKIYFFSLLFMFFLITGQAFASGHSVKASSLASLQVLDLKTAQQIALSSNPSIEAGAARVRSAKEQVEQASSLYWPRVDSELAYSRVDLSSRKYNSALMSATVFNATVDDPSDNYSARLSLIWNLFSGFETTFSVAAAQFGENESRAAFLEGNRLLLDAVAKSYYNAQLARENISIASANQDYYRKLHEDSQARRRVGSGSLSTELSLEVQVNNAKAQLIAVKYGYDAAVIGLAALMGMNTALPQHLSLAPLGIAKQSDFILPAKEEYVRLAMEGRPDIWQYQSRIESARSREDIAKSQFYPKFDLRATYNGERTEDSGFNSDDFGNTISLNLSYNLFAGGLYSRKISEAKHGVTAAQKDFENVEIRIRQEIYEAIIDIQSAQEQLVLQRTTLGLVEKNRNLIKKEYEAGQAILIRLKEAQRDYNTTKSVLARSRVALKLAWHNLEIRTGQKGKSIQADLEVEK